MKHLLLVIPLGVIAYMFFLLYQQGAQINAKEKQEEKVYIKEVNRKNGLKACLQKEEDSIQASILSHCTTRGIAVRNCKVSEGKMNEIAQRVHENKQICYLKFTEE